MKIYNGAKKEIFVLALIAGLVVVASIGLKSCQAISLNDFYNKYLKPFIALPAKTGAENAVETKPVEIYAPTVDYETAVIKAVEKASPAVVSVVVSKDLPVLEQCPYDPFSSFFGDDLFRNGFGGFNFTVPCPSSDKTEKKTIGGGTGFIVSEDGLILTNNHVVADTKAEYTVLLNDGSKYLANILARDSVKDLALMHISATGLKALSLGNSDAIKLGQTAIAIGNALGEFKNTVSVGVVSGLDRSVTAQNTNGGIELIESVIQTDAAINPGNSGGPLLNLKGEVIGVNTAIVSNAQNIGFAIPVNKARQVIDSFKKTGRIMVPYLGVRFNSLPIGAKITSSAEELAVMKDSPADKAGLKEGDIIIEVNGGKLSEEKTLSSVIQKYEVGDTLTLKIKRGEEVLTLKAVLGEKPKE